MKNLKKISLIVALFTGLTSCLFAQTSKDKKIPYTVAKRYFVKNTVPDGIFFYPKITSQEAFENLFGMATVMGKDGTPTPIDFSKQYVIAVINHTTNAAVTLDAKSLIEKNGKLTFTYAKTEAESKSSAFFRYCLIVIVDNKYKGEVSIQDEQKQEQVPYTPGRNYFVNNTVEAGVILQPKITNQETFDRFFGMAPLMGEGGQPTAIDFSKQYVIAVIDAETNSEEGLTVKSLIRKDGVITLTYNKPAEAGNATATYRYCLILIVDNDYKGEVKIVKAN